MTAIRCRCGFSLLEVMVALAIVAGVVLTVLGAVNYHAGIIANERDSIRMTLLARARLAELEQSPATAKGEGSFAPLYPELRWKSELLDADIPGLQRLIVRVQNTADKREVALVRYLAK